jgi:hypothetical protein
MIVQQSVTKIIKPMWFKKEANLLIRTNLKKGEYSKLADLEGRTTTTVTSVLDGAHGGRLDPGGRHS